MIIFKVNEMGFIHNRIDVPEDHVLEADEAPDSCPAFVAPRWDGQQWVEGATNPVLADRTSDLKFAVVSRIKSEAHKQIVAVATVYRQINWILDQRMEDPDVLTKIARIQNLRQQSNAMEQVVLALSDYRQVAEYVIQFV